MRGTFRDHDRLDEFIGYAPFVAAADGFDRIGGFHWRIAVNDGAISLLDALPAVVAIHRVVTACERRNAPASGLAHFLWQLADVGDSAMWRRIAAGHEAMDIYALDVLLARHSQHRKLM